MSSLLAHSMSCKMICPRYLAQSKSHPSSHIHDSLFLQFSTHWSMWPTPGNSCFFAAQSTSRRSVPPQRSLKLKFSKPERKVC